MSDACAFVIGFILSAIICIGAASEAGKKSVRSEAVEQGYASWVPDKFGKTTFQWKESK